MQVVAKGTALQKVHQIKSHYTREHIVHIFQNRLDDEMFLEIGRLYAKKDDVTENDLIWRGYEVLTESLYLEI